MSDSESVTHSVSQNEFRNLVKEYVELFDRLSDIRKQTAALNKRKKNISQTILTFMEENEKHFCNLGEKGTLQMKTTKSKQALKKEDVQKLLLQLGNGEQESKDTAEFLFANKRVVTRNTLRRNVKPLD